MGLAHHERNGLDDSMLSVHDLGELAEYALMSLGARLVDELSCVLAGFGRQAGEHRLLVDPVVPGGDMTLLGIAGDVLAVGSRGFCCRLGRLYRVAAHEAHGNGGAGRQALDVRFPGAWERLVEVIDGEHQVALGRSEDTEVGDVHVAAGVYLRAGRGRRGEVRGHHDGRAAEEGEGRGQHAREAHRGRAGRRSGERWHGSPAASSCAGSCRPPCFRPPTAATR